MKTPHLLTLTFFMCCWLSYGQTGIGTPLPHNSSELEIFSNERGLLIPRIELKSKTDKSTIIGTPYPESLFVYHTGSKDLLAGFYFWSADKWNALVSNSTLYHYIKEEASPDSVTITHDKEDYIFTWKDKNTLAQMTMRLSDVIKKFETLTELKTEYLADEAVLVYTPERGDETRVKLTELLKGSKVFNQYITTLASGSNNYYSTLNEEVIGKWENKDIMRSIHRFHFGGAFTSVELSQVIPGLIVDAKLINGTTNSMTRGIISKQIVGDKTKIVIGTAGTILPNHPAGPYYVIVEYVKE